MSHCKLGDQATVKYTLGNVNKDFVTSDTPVDVLVHQRPLNHTDNFVPGGYGVDWRVPQLGANTRSNSYIHNIYGNYPIRDHEFVEPIDYYKSIFPNEWQQRYNDFIQYYRNKEGTDEWVYYKYVYMWFCQNRNDWYRDQQGRKLADQPSQVCDTRTIQIFPNVVCPSRYPPLPNYCSIEVKSNAGILLYSDQGDCPCVLTEVLCKGQEKCPFGTCECTCENNLVCCYNSQGFVVKSFYR